MRRQVDHHLARARAIGRRASAHARVDGLGQPRSGRARGRPALRERHGRHRRRPQARRSGSSGRISTKCSAIWSKMPRNMAAAGCSSRSSRKPTTASTSWSRTTARASRPAERETIFDRGARLDTTGKPGTGLGLAIVRDVAEIYGGTIRLEESEDLGGLLARLTLPGGLGNRACPPVTGAAMTATIHQLRSGARALARSDAGAGRGRHERGQRGHPRADAVQGRADPRACRPSDRRRRQAHAADADPRLRQPARLLRRAPPQARRRGRVHPHRDPAPRRCRRRLGHCAAASAPPTSSGAIRRACWSAISCSAARSS